MLLTARERLTLQISRTNSIPMYMHLLIRIMMSHNNTMPYVLEESFICNSETKGKCYLQYCPAIRLASSEILGSNICLSFRVRDKRIFKNINDYLSDESVQQNAIYYVFCQLLVVHQIFKPLLSAI